MSITVPATLGWIAGPTGITAQQSLTISATGTVIYHPAPRYAFPEGAYPPDFPDTHSEDIKDTNPPIAGQPIQNVRCPSLGMAVVAAGAGAPGTANGSVPKGIQVARTAKTYYASDFAQASGSVGPWDVYFMFSDTGYGDNSGTFTVTATVAQVDGQRLSEIIALPGHETQDDINNARYCSVLGVLTPGNRVRRVDERDVCDLVAPFKNPGPKDQ